jgi:wobble nucleotide-excising tRNase
MKEIRKMAEKFRQDIKPPFKMDSIVSELADWISLNQDALLLAWFAEYGFSPGKAILVHSHDMEGSKYFIREMTPEEIKQNNIKESANSKQNTYMEGFA